MAKVQITPPLGQEEKIILNTDSEQDEVIRETMREQENDNEFIQSNQNHDRSLFSYG